MLFNSFSYPAFLLLAVLLYWVSPKNARPWILTLSGLAFYTASGLWALLLICTLSALTLAVGIHLTARKDKRLFAFTLVLVLGTFCVLKYGNLILASVSGVSGLSLPVLRVAMPLGISFFTFEFVHYLAERYKGTIGPHSAVDFLCFTFFFPTLLAGPIKRFSQFQDSLEGAVWNERLFMTGLLLILFGYAQKYVLADPLTSLTLQLEHPEVLQTTIAAAGGLFLYAFRIYFDFAGLSNIAIGSAMLFGVIVPKNFRNPYCKPNIQQFWRSWHMSLSSWVQDYVYIPMGGSRRGTVMTYVNLVLSMGVVGLWHGASWNFLIWGLYHGCGLAVHRAWNKLGFSFGSSFPGRIAGVLCTFVFVAVGWAFFVTHSLPDSLLLLGKIFPFMPHA